MYFSLRSGIPGFSDPIYAEAYVKMNGFDILLGQLLSL
jgi:coatomer subunit beta